jgi:hypothetical protein
LPVDLHECGAWSLTLKEEHRLKAFVNRVLWIIFGLKSEKVTGEWRRLHNAELDDLYCNAYLRERVCLPLNLVQTDVTREIFGISTIISILVWVAGTDRINDNIKVMSHGGYLNYSTIT